MAACFIVVRASRLSGMRWMVAISRRLKRTKAATNSRNDSGTTVRGSMERYESTVGDADAVVDGS